MRIQSILDNDLYKFTMQHAVVQLFPRALARFSFVNRDGRAFPPGFDQALRAAVQQMEQLALTAHEKQFLARACYYLPPTYLDFLSGYRYDASEVRIQQVGEQLRVDIEGYWYRTILWEVPLMALISEMYFDFTGQAAQPEEWVRQNVAQKAQIYDALGVHYADFGTRRRYSAHVHQVVVETLKANSKQGLIGTSNVHLAQVFDLKPIGTHAHEWFMFHAAKYGYKLANRLAMDNWVQVYRGDLGIALSDTYTTEVFFRTFDTQLAKLFDGVRQDSGSPLEFADKAIEHYRRLNIDPLTKSIVFSDNLNPDTVRQIADHCRGRIRFSFGIGTNFTNDVGVKAMNMVIKLTAARPENYDDWVPTVKLSDSPGKYLGPAEEVSICKALLRLP